MIYCLSNVNLYLSTTPKNEKKKKLFDGYWRCDDVNQYFFYRSKNKNNEEEEKRHLKQHQKQQFSIMMTTLKSLNKINVHE